MVGGIWCSTCIYTSTDCCLATFCTSIPTKDLIIPNGFGGALLQEDLAVITTALFYATLIPSSLHMLEKASGMCCPVAVCGTLTTAVSTAAVHVDVVFRFYNSIRQCGLAWCVERKRGQEGD